MKLFALKYNNSYYEFTTDINKLLKYKNSKLVSVVEIKTEENENGDYYLLTKDDINDIFITNIFPLVKDKIYKRVLIKEI